VAWLCPVGFAADKFGRKKSYVFYLVVAAILVPLFGMTTSMTTLLILGPFVGFFGTGYFSGFAAIASELFPTEIRATAMGLTYNIGRGFSAIAPFVVGAIAKEYSFMAAFLLPPPRSWRRALTLALPETKERRPEAWSFLRHVRSALALEARSAPRATPVAASTSTAPMDPVRGPRAAGRRYDQHLLGRAAWVQSTRHGAA
jgi:MFS family permease